MEFPRRRLVPTARIRIVLLALAAAPGLAAAPAPPVHPLNGHEEEGRFTYYVNEDYVGASHSTWSADGSFVNEATVTMAGQTIESSLKIEVDEKGMWTAISMETVRGPARFERSGGSVRTRVGGKTDTIELKPGTRIMEDMSPALMSQAVAAYDHEKGGKQEFPLLFLPGVQIEASLEQLDSFERLIDGEQRSFRSYRYMMPPVYQVDLIVDERARVCLAEYPAQHGLFIREGYDALGARDASDALLSRPLHEVVVERGVGVPMRDGVKLATDLYRPDREGKSPVILVRTPYKKEMVETQARFYARRGYVFAVQDVRGKFSSPGEWRPFVHEADDGHDAVEWLAARPWSDGKVGMIGGSYLGWVQWWAASRKPPHLVTLVSNVAPPEPFYNFPYQYGAFWLGPALWWTDAVESGVSADLSGVALEQSYEIFEPGKLAHLPVVELDEVALGRKSPQWREWIAHPTYDEYWRSLAYLDALSGLEIPVYHQSGWFDANGLGSKLNFQGMVARGRPNQKLVLGPWGHTDTDSRFGRHGIDWGPKSVIDLQKSYLRWMDRWLKGIDNGIDKEPTVSLFVMGSNDWLHGDAYPLKGTRMSQLYLSSAGDAAGFDGKGGFSFRPPGDEESPPDRFRYDPGDPTPESPVGREDLLVYTTPPMDGPRTLAGPVSAVIFASSSARDTDWVARLARIDAQGNPLVLAQGILRARFRESLSDPELLEPGKIYEYRIDMGHTGVTLQKGERLKLVVSSAWFPMFSRNLNTGGDNQTGTEYVTAEQAVYHDREHPSHLLLPVIAEPSFGRP